MTYEQHLYGALGGTRTPNPLIRSQMLYPLSYERKFPLNTSRKYSYLLHYHPC